jgi:excisionase family DNA binding protein
MRVFRDQDDDQTEPLLITAKQAAKMLCISQRYLYTLSKSGRIPVVAFGRRRLYRVADVERFVSSHSVPAGPVAS